MSAQVITPISGIKLGIDSPMTGGLTPIPDAGNNPKIIALARWAVDEYNKEQGRELKFTKVILANTQVVSGIMYYITLETLGGGIVRLFEAIVLEESPNCKKLVSFNGLE